MTDEETGGADLPAGESGDGLSDEQRAGLEAAADEYQRLKDAGLAADAMEIVVAAVGQGKLKAGFLYLDAVRIRKAGLDRGFRLGI